MSVGEAKHTPSMFMPPVPSESDLPATDNSNSNDRSGSFSHSLGGAGVPKPSAEVLNHSVSPQHNPMVARAAMLDTQRDDAPLNRYDASQAQHLTKWRRGSMSSLLPHDKVVDSLQTSPSKPQQRQQES